MSENIFQILLLLSYFDIALISITIAVYAVSVSYLGRETSRSISRRKRRVAELKESIGSLSTRIRDEREISAIEKEIAHYKQSQKSLERSLLWISVKGAVYTPTAFFSVSFLLCVLGMLEVLNPEILLALSSVFIVLGGVCLGKTLKATEKAAMEIPKPRYEVFFRSTELMTKQCRANTPTKIEPIFHNIGDERSENPLLVIYFPEGVVVEKKYRKWEKALGISKGRPYGRVGSCYVDRDVGIINVDQFLKLGSITIIAKQGTHKIPVEIKDKSGKSVHELILEVE